MFRKMQKKPGRPKKDTTRLDFKVLDKAYLILSIHAIESGYTDSRGRVEWGKVWGSIAAGIVEGKIKLSKKLDE